MIPARFPLVAIQYLRNQQVRLLFNNDTIISFRLPHFPSSFLCHILFPLLQVSDTQDHQFHPSDTPTFISRTFLPRSHSIPFHSISVPGMMVSILPLLSSIPSYPPLSYHIVPILIQHTTLSSFYSIKNTVQTPLSLHTLLSLVTLVYLSSSTATLLRYISSLIELRISPDPFTVHTTFRYYSTRSSNLPIHPSIYYDSFDYPEP